MQKKNTVKFYNKIITTLKSLGSVLGTSLEWKADFEML